MKDDEESLERTLAGRYNIPQGSRVYEISLSLSFEPKLPHESRREYVTRAKTLLEQFASPIEKALQQAGGIVYERSWSSSSLLVSIPDQQLENIKKIEGIVSIERPRMIEEE